MTSIQQPGSLLLSLISIPVIFILIEGIYDRVTSYRTNLSRLIPHIIALTGVLVIDSLVLMLLQIYLQKPFGLLDKATEWALCQCTVEFPFPLFIDSLSFFFILLTAFIFTFVIMFTTLIQKRDQYTGLFYALIFAVLLGVFVVLLQDNFVLLLLAWEVMALACYGLVTFKLSDRRTLEAGLKYFLTSSCGSLLSMFGISIIYGEAGTLNFATLANNFNPPQTLFHYFALTCIITGFGITSGIFILNRWLPDVYQVSTIYPILSSGIILNIGVYTIFRAGLYLIPDSITSLAYSGSIFSSFLLLLAILTITEGNIMMLAQFKRKTEKNICRILGYSTIIHMGYIVLGLGIGGVLGLASTLFYILNNAITKSFLLAIVNSIQEKYATADLEKLKGLGQNHPAIAILTALALFSSAGLPLTGGFIAKLLMILSLATATAQLGGIALVLVLVLILNATTSFIAVLWLLRYLFTYETSKELLMYEKEFTYANKNLQLLLFATISVLIFIFGIIPAPILDFVSNVL